MGEEHLIAALIVAVVIVLVLASLQGSTKATHQCDKSRPVMIKEQLEAACHVGPNSLRACEDKWSAFLAPVIHSRSGAQSGRAYSKRSGRDSLRDRRPTLMPRPLVTSV